MSAADETPRHRSAWAVRALAVVGALALIALAGAGVWVALATRPGSSQTPAAPSTSAATAAVDTPAPTPGDLGTDGTWLQDLDLDAGALVAGGLELRDARVKGTGVRTLEDGSLRADRLAVDGVVPYAVVERQVGRGLTLRAGPDGLVRATLPVTVLGADTSVTADARVTAEGDRLAIDPVRVVDAGPLGGVVDRIPTIRQPVPGLPAGLRLTDITPTDAGLRIHAEGADVTVRR